MPAIVAIPNVVEELVMQFGLLYKRYCWRTLVQQLSGTARPLEACAVLPYDPAIVPETSRSSSC
jgi:hypothetical protein